MAETPECLNILNGTTTGATPSSFASGNGFIYLVDGSDCWVNVIAQIDEQLALAESGLN